MDSSKGYLRDENMLGIHDELESLIDDFSDDFDVEIEEKSYLSSGMSGMIERVMQEYIINLNNTELRSQIYIFNTPMDVEEILSNQEAINYEEYCSILEKRNPAGRTRIMYFEPDEEFHNPLEVTQEHLELIERFNDELEFLAMADGKVNYGEKYLHVFDLTE